MIVGAHIGVLPNGRPTRSARQPLYEGFCSGFSANSPTTVVHSRTRHLVTSPLTTYGSFVANASATAGDDALNSRTVPSTGLAKAPPSTSSPRSSAWFAYAR